MLPLWSCLLYFALLTNYRAVVGNISRRPQAVVPGTAPGKILVDSSLSSHAEPGLSSFSNTFWMPSPSSARKRTSFYWVRGEFVALPRTPHAFDFASDPWVASP